MRANLLIQWARTRGSRDQRFDSLAGNSGCKAPRFNSSNGKVEPLGGAR
jgi:hypothetical protein